MFSTIKLINIPSQLSGLALAIVSLGQAWAFVLPTDGATITLIFGAISGLLILALTLKFIAHPASLLADLANPILGGAMCTFTMAVMVLAYISRDYATNISSIIWGLGLTLHLLFLIVFFFYRSKQLNLDLMVPSWFIPPVGLIISVTTQPQGVFDGFSTTIICFSIGSFFLVLPFMLYRLIFRPPVPDTAQPILAVLAAPPSLSLASYLSVNATHSMSLIFILLPIAIMMTAILYLFAFRHINKPFSHTFSAFTFPAVVSAMALLVTASCLDHEFNMPQFAATLSSVATMELYIATAIVLFVSAHYLFSFYMKIRRPTISTA